MMRTKAPNTVLNTASVADLNNKMVDDVKIVLAEYRLALKKNNVEREK